MEDDIISKRLRMKNNPIARVLLPDYPIPLVDDIFQKLPELPDLMPFGMSGSATVGQLDVCQIWGQIQVLLVL